MPEIHWRHYAENKLAPIRRKLTGKHPEACGAFESALRAGDKANAVYRDYADSLYRLGSLKKAAEMVKVVLDRDPENVFILDLLARVHLHSDRLDDAEEIIKLLERYDLSKRFAHHRKAALLCKKSLWDLALIEAGAACGTGFSPFEAFAQQANILIELNRFGEAKSAIVELEKKFRTQGRDVRHGLSCKLLLRENLWREARSVWDQLEDKQKPIHRRLLLNIYLRMGKDSSLPLKERADAQRHYEQLTRDLEGIPDGDLLQT